MESLVHIIIAIAVLIVAWLVVERFSPDPLITQIAKIVIFVAALVLILYALVPMVHL